MINHISIAVKEPKRVAEVLAEIWNGVVYPFPPAPGSFIVLADDGRGTAVEITPAGTVLVTTLYGGSRIVDMLVGDPLPRIC